MNHNSRYFLQNFILISLVLTVTSIGVAQDQPYRWDGHPFVMCFITDDGTKCNLGWADKAKEMDFRFTIAVNQGRPSDKRLSQQDMIDLYNDGFEIANHTYSHGKRGVPITCPSPPMGSLQAYFLCPDFDPVIAQTYFQAEIARDSLATFIGQPVEAIKTMAYPMHRHSFEIIEALIGEGYIGGRYAENSSYSSLSNGDFTVPARNAWDSGISLFRVPLAHYSRTFFGNHSADPPEHFTNSEFVAATQPYIDIAIEQGGIFAVYTHHYGDDDDTFGDINYGGSGMTDIDLEWMADLVRANGGVIWTFEEAVEYYRAHSRHVEIDGDHVWVPFVSSVSEFAETRVPMSMYPNPFNANIDIFYETQLAGEIIVSIYNLEGRKVRELASGYHATGQHQVSWDGRDKNGRDQASGVYLVRYNSTHKSHSERITLVK